MNLAKREKLTLLFEKYKNFLTQNQIQTMHLYLIEDLSLSEIAKILATSRQSIHDAIKKSEKKLILINQKISNT